MIIKSGNGYDIEIDYEDYDLVKDLTWTAIKYHNTMYAKYTQSRTYMHRLLTNASSGEITDHRDGNGLNNKRSNLKLGNSQINAARGRSHTDGSSDYKGVSYDYNRGLWAAEIMSDGTRYRLGRYETEVEAATAYNMKAVELYGKDAIINEISS